MPSPESIHLLKYWRNTLADAARVEIPVDKMLHCKKAVVNYEMGYVNIKQAAQLIRAVEKQLNGANDKDFTKGKSLEKIPVLIAPFRVSPLPEYTKLSGETGVFYPFWIRASLTREGILTPDEDTFPYIPRTYLEPQVNQTINYTFAGVDQIDSAFSRPFTQKGNWFAYCWYIGQTFKAITGVRLGNYAVEDFTVTYENTIVVNELITGAADGIIQLYDYLIRHEEVPPLLASLCNRSYEPLNPLLTVDAFEAASTQHVGQMSYEFPLSVSQRKTLYHFNSLPEGNILAVNGPPGTGKTTLLQSIVANEVVKKAILGKEPAVILACSTNNQAVTNIIDSFAKVKPKQGLLYERWLPDLTGFGLYLPSESKVVAKDTPYYKLKQGGFPEEIQTEDYIDRARQKFIHFFERYSGVRGLSVSKIVDHLRTTLQTKQQQLDEGIRLWQQYKTITSLVDRLNGEPSIQLLTQGVLNEEALNGVETALKALEVKVSDYLDGESVWMKLLAFLKIIKEKRATRLRQLFRDGPVGYETVNFYEISMLHPFFDEKLRLIKQIRELNKTWITWKQANGLKGNPPLTDADFNRAEKDRQPFFYDELEIGTRYDLFYLAVHYWEGRWILDTSLAIEEKRIEKKGSEHVKDKWRRFAMLTPCFVSTFYMAPKFFTYSKFVQRTASGSVFESPPLLHFVDLLIVDEAGQVSPEVGAVTFALAKQAVVVGDTLQIEPVWNVPKKVDYANLVRYKVIPSVDDEATVTDLLNKGFLSSSGSVMRLAQKASGYHLYPEAERGMLLTEHRRCFDEIIEYCNQLAYNGLLVAKKGPAKDTFFSPIQFIHTGGESERVGSSKGNKVEAEKIAEWIRKNADGMLKHYQQKENKEAINEGRAPRQMRLSDVLGIITPFTGQKRVLKETFQKAGIDTANLTIGTVHALQGAERPVILFSATYSENDQGKSYFFDAGVNMLNVAVSRAKEAFIVFGNRDNFDQKGTAPSVQLYRHIQRVEKELV